MKTFYAYLMIMLVSAFSMRAMENNKQCIDLFLGSCFGAGALVGGYMAYENLSDHDWGQRSSGAVIFGSITGFCGTMVGVGLLYVGVKVNEIGTKVGKRCVAWCNRKLHND